MEKKKLSLGVAIREKIMLEDSLRFLPWWEEKEEVQKEEEEEEMQEEEMEGGIGTSRKGQSYGL
jgi:hypothetical protein